MRKRIDLSLYLVLDPDLCGGAEGMVRTAQLAAKNGATAVQLRAPEWKKRQWLSTARDLKTVLAPFGVPLIINDQVDVALMVKADGVHVGQDDLPAAEVRTLIGPQAILGLSVTNFNELAEVTAGVNYLGIGPVYLTGSKPDAAPATGVEAFGAMVAATRLPVVAIGGILEHAQAGQAAQTGAAGVCVVRGLGDDLASSVPAWQAAIASGRGQERLPTPALPHPSLLNQ